MNDGVPAWSESVTKLRLLLLVLLCLPLCIVHYCNLLTRVVNRLAAACAGAPCHRGTAALHSSPSSGFSPQTAAAPAHDLAHEPECGHASFAWHHWHTYTGKEQLCPVTDYTYTWNKLSMGCSDTVCPFFFCVCECSWCKLSLAACWAVRRK